METMNCTLSFQGKPLKIHGFLSIAESTFQKT